MADRSPPTLMSLEFTSALDISGGDKPEFHGLGYS
jgi:hypothetical protein